jgi:xanthine dehydrogenase YagR molybdenum-binding subunit
MKFDQPAGTNPIDQLRVVGKPTDRIDGPLKVSGRARYAYEQHDVAPSQAYGWIVPATIPKGKITVLDTTAAEAAPGVLAVVSARNAGKLGKGDFNVAALLAGPDVQHYHQAVAIVVAETFEQARDAAGLVRVDYEEETGSFDLAAAKATAVPPPADDFNGEPDTAVGDFDSAFASAPVKLDETYSTPDHSQTPMEPHATVAAWEGDKLTLWTSNQMVAWTRGDVAKTFGLSEENVRLVSPFVGGGFGSKLYLRADAVMAALGARASGRPVKVTLQRPLALNNTTHRPATIQRIRIGATSDGAITAIAHEAWSGNLEGGRAEAAANQTRLIYAGPNRKTATRLARLDLPEGSDMRAPGEAPGMMALEVAIDEMAEKLGMDPIEFRIRNNTETDPENPGRRFSQHLLVDCYRKGAEVFGWSKRNPKPGATRDGRWLVGIGMAAGFRNNILFKSGARVRLGSDGMVTVETDMTDIGTGTYTIAAQTAAEMMGLPLERVIVRLGDSDFPAACGSGGQFGAANSTAGIYAACVKLREEVSRKLGVNSADAAFVDGEVVSGNRRIALAEAAKDGELVAEDVVEYGDISKREQQSTFAAHFVEVGVDVATAEIRLRRMLAVCAAGRILNPKSARSQVLGGMTMGLGAALMEELAVDKRRGFFVNHDLAGYEVPVHADIHHQEVIFLDEPDPSSTPMKAKGVGELGICGVGGAVANAIYNATGIRVRDYPITLDKLLGKMREAA